MTKMSQYPFLRLVWPSFLVVMIIAGFYVGRYISPMYIPIIGIVYFFLISILVVFLRGQKCIRNKKGLFRVLLSVFVIHAVYFMLLYVYSKPYRSSLEKDLSYLWAMFLSGWMNGFWIWFCLPKQSTVFAKPLLSRIIMTNFFVIVIIMFMAPNYCDYTDRTYISEGLAIATVAKMASTDFYEQEKRFPMNNQEAGLVKPNQITGQSVKAIEILPQGKIKIIYNDKLADNAFLFLKAVFNDRGEMIWQCHEVDRLEMKMLPSNCREQVGLYRESSGSTIAY